MIIPASSPRVGFVGSHATAWLAASILLLSAGCSLRQAYDTGQEWQRNTCYRLADAVERERCLAGTKMSYDDYRRKVEPPAPEKPAQEKPVPPE